MKLYNVAGKSWWVPNVAAQTMAVRIRTPQEFRLAIREKMYELALQTSNEEREYLARITAGASSEPYHLVEMGLEQLNLLEWIRTADPEFGADAAEEKEALEAIANQDEVTLADFLG